MSSGLRTSLKKLRIELPQTQLGFPMDHAVDRDATRPMKSRGIALIIAIMIISIMMMFASDFIVSSTVDLTLAAATRDNIKAEYVAKSGANWATWLNLFDYGLDVQFSSSKEPMMKQAKTAIGPLWNKLNDIFPFDTPLDLSQVEAFAKAFNLNSTLDSEVIEMFKSLGGELGVGVEDEGGKINLNICYQNVSNCKIIVAQLKALMTCTDVEKDFIKRRDLKVDEIVARIQDWIDQNSVSEPASGSSSEDDIYLKRTPTHKAKNSPLDTLDELLVVDGWTNELHSYFSDYLTFFPFTHSQDKDKSAYKLNVNSVNPDILKCFFAKELNSPEAKENFVKKYKELMSNGQIASSDSDLQSFLKDVIGFQVDAADKGKDTDKGNWLSTQSRAFKIRAKGVVGSQTKIVDLYLERQAIVQRKGTSDTAPWRLDGYRLY
jgi:type II secretory pathway component PulK